MIFDHFIYNSFSILFYFNLFNIHCISLTRTFIYFNQTAATYQEMLGRQVTNPVEIAISEGQLTWLVYIIGSAIGGRLSMSANDEHDVMDGELVFRVSLLIH